MVRVVSSSFATARALDRFQSKAKKGIRVACMAITSHSKRRVNRVRLPFLLVII